MKIIIDIPDDDYEFIKEQVNMGYCNNVRQINNRLYHFVANGTVLPEGHGRLFILDEAKAKNYLTNFSFSSQSWISEVGISEATLKVIEADKGEKKNDKQRSKGKDRALGSATKI